MNVSMWKVGFCEGGNNRLMGGLHQGSRSRNSAYDQSYWSKAKFWIQAVYTRIQVFKFESKQIDVNVASLPHQTSLVPTQENTLLV